MSRKRYTPEQIISMLREAEVALAQGQSVGQACRTLGVSEQSYYRWRKEYGGLRTDQAKRLKGIVRGNVLELSGVLVLASVDEKPIPIFQDVTRGYPPGGDDVYPFPPVAAASRGPAS